MKRLLLTGALVASVFLCATAAQAQIMEPTITNVLRVTVITKPPMKPPVTKRVFLQYHSRHTCEAALERLDLQFIRQSIKADRVTAACVEPETNPV